MTRSARWSLVGAFLILGGGTVGFLASPLLRGQVPAAPAIPKELTSYRDVVKRILPAVVSIEVRAKPVKTKAPARRPRDLDPRIPEEFRRFFEEYDTPERQQPAMGFGSGFIIDPKGIILTNYHVVDGADQVEVQLADGRKFLSKEVQSDPKTDLATVKIDPKGAVLPYLEFGDSDTMEIGDRVLAVGAPFGLTGSVTHGIISAKGRNMNMNLYEDFVQTDAPINPGNSGGPLVNLEGKVIGINSAIKSRSGGFQGVGLAIASNLAKNVMDQLLKDGAVHRGYLGVQIKDLDPDVAAKLGLKAADGGVVVAQVFEKAPAAKGGVEAGDVIVAVAGKAVKDGRDLQRLVAGLPLNKPVELSVWRDGQKKTLQVTVEEQPTDFGSARVPAPVERRRERGSAPMSLDKLGVEVNDLTPEMAADLGYKENAKGAVVTSVEEGSVGEAAGLRRGTMIVKVEKTPVASAKELKEALDKETLDKGVLLQVQSPAGGLSYVVIKAAESAAQK